MNSDKYIKTVYNQPFISQRADPYVYRDHAGKYWFTASVPEYDRIILRNSDTLDGLQTANEITVWKKHEYGPMSVHVWAPEIHQLFGKWYIYFAAGDKDNIWNIRPYVLECEGDDPQSDSWHECGMLAHNDAFSFNDFSLDMTIFENKGKYYCVWAEKVNIGKKISNLYIAELKTPTTLATEQVLLSAPDYDWERIGFWVNEGPAILHHDGTIYLTYSASSTGPCYCIGMLRIPETAEILDPHAWKKERFPVLKTDINKGLFGPGHNCFSKLEDGSDVMIYHARTYDEIIGDPLYDPNRHTYRMIVKWNDNNQPIFDFSNNF